MCCRSVGSGFPEFLANLTQATLHVYNFFRNNNICFIKINWHEYKMVLLQYIYVHNKLFCTLIQVLSLSFIELL